MLILAWIGVTGSFKSKDFVHSFLYAIPVVDWQDHLWTKSDLYPHPGADHTQFGSADFFVFKLQYAESHLNGDILESNKLELEEKKFDLATLDPRFDCKRSETESGTYIWLVY